MNTIIAFHCLVVILMASKTFCSSTDQKRSFEECADSKIAADVRYCHPNVWPPWWGLGEMPCTARKHIVDMYRKCRKTCNLCDIYPQENGPAPCDANPCLNGANCVNRGVQYLCICPERFTGDQCQIAHSCSEPGYTAEYNVNLCYKLYNDDDDLKTYSEAQAMCKADGGSLVAIDWQTYDVFRSILKVDKFVHGTSTSGYWTDGKNNDMVWYFSDGTQITLFMPGLDPDRDLQTQPVCMSLFWDDKLQGQIYRSCDNTRLNFICSMPTTVIYSQH